MLDVHFEVAFVDGTSRVGRTTPLAEVLTERRYGVHAAQLTRQEHVYHICWASLADDPDDLDAFDRWLEQLVELTVLADVEEDTGVDAELDRDAEGVGPAG